MSDEIEDGGELSPDAKAFLARHAATGEPSAEALARVEARVMAAPAVEPRKRAFGLSSELMAAAAVVILVLGAQGLYLAYQSAQRGPQTLADLDPAHPDVQPIVEAWIAGDFAAVKQLAADCRSPLCRPLLSALPQVLGLAFRLETLSDAELDELSAFDRQLTDKDTVVSRLVDIRLPPLAAKAMADTLFEQAQTYRGGRSLERAVIRLEECIRISPEYHPCHRLLGSVYASIGERDRSERDREKARAAYTRFLEVAPADDEYVPRVRALLAQPDTAPEQDWNAGQRSASHVSPANAQDVSVYPGEERVYIWEREILQILDAKPSIATVTVSEKRRLHVKGVGPGSFTAMLRLAGGSFGRVLIEVLPNPGEATDERLTIVRGDQRTLTMPEEVRWARVGDPVIADIYETGERTLQLTGMGAGQTTLRVQFKSGARQNYLVEVISHREEGADDAVFYLNEEAVKELLGEAEKARVAGDLPSAVGLALMVLATDPKHAGALQIIAGARFEARQLYLQGYVLRETDPQQAIRVFRKVVSLTEPQDELHQRAKFRLSELEK